MKKLKLSLAMIKKFNKHLREEKRSSSTLEKYMRDVYTFYEFLPENKEITKEGIVAFLNDRYFLFLLKYR